MLDELTEHPLTGTGKPELLKHELTGLWSRRINKEHRIVYGIKENTVYEYSLKGHYFRPKR
ncbi:MAG TPA: Txe/YoeB family addiction module toxin [Daejeonella sp.]|nr:Txe/YoeB family addiction module toxin [Daejeonella sp.]